MVSGVSGITTATITLAGTALAHGDLSSAALTAPIVHLLTAALAAKQEIAEKKQTNPFTFVVLAEQKA